MIIGRSIETERSHNKPKAMQLVVKQFEVESVVLKPGSITVSPRSYLHLFISFLIFFSMCSFGFCFAGVQSCWLPFAAWGAICLFPWLPSLLSSSPPSLLSIHSMFFLPSFFLFNFMDFLNLFYFILLIFLFVSNLLE